MGPLKGRPAWDQVSAPEHSGTYKEEAGKAGRFAGSAGLSSESGLDPANKQGSHESARTTHSMGNGNVKKIPSVTPDNSDVGSIASVWGGKGVGGY